MYFYIGTFALFVVVSGWWMDKAAKKINALEARMEALQPIVEHYARAMKRDAMSPAERSEQVQQAFATLDVELKARATQSVP